MNINMTRAAAWYGLLMLAFLPRRLPCMHRRSH